MTRAVQLVLAAFVAVAIAAACANDSTPTAPSPGAPTISLPRPEGVGAADWALLQSELARVLSMFKTTSAAAPPLDALSKVNDLQVSGTPGNPATFSWSFRSTGDYDQNGEVNISDLSPIGLYYRAKSGDANWARAQVADGDRNGEVNIADITPIGARYRCSITGYELQYGAADSGPWTALADILLGAATDPPGGGFKLFEHTATAQASDAFYRVVPYLGDGPGRQYGIGSISVFIGAGQLDPPSNVAASTVYHDRISVTWSKSIGATQYLVYRDNQDTALATLGDVALYDDAAVADNLPHTYWVRGKAGVMLSNFSAAATGQKALNPPELEPPIGVQASDGDHSDYIALTWTKPTGATGYEIYRDSKQNLLATVGDQAYYDDSSIADSLAHTYWVLALKAPDVRSEYSVSDTGYRGGAATGTMVVLGYNDLGMHCMNQDFSELMILPPFNTLHATVIDRSGEWPQIVISGVTVRYSVGGNTYSVGKTNFWDFEQILFGTQLAPNIGLTGNGLAGVMQPSGGGLSDWQASGIPITPIMDDGSENAYPLASIAVFDGTTETANTQAVVPVSWEISCDLCHISATRTPMGDILKKHDVLHGTSLENMKPVKCGMCHAQPELGLDGIPGFPTLSSAVHSAHAPRMGYVDLEVDCYACHPGVKTQCLRDVHFSAGMTCVDCHGTMTDVGNPARQPWVDEPRCETCHTRPGFEFEQPDTLYRNSKGHRGVQCAACHGSPHAIYPTVVSADNLQSIALQGHPGKIDTCTVCHSSQPGDPFPHKVADE